MGWWESEKGNPVGDGPADALGQMLKAIREHAEASDNALTLSKFLRYFVAILNSNPQILLDKDRLPLKHISAVLTGNVTVEAEETVIWDKTISETIRRTLVTVAQDFQNTFDRLPTVNDLLANLEFVMSEPTDYVIVNTETDEVLLWEIKVS